MASCCAVVISFLGMVTTCLFFIYRYKQSFKDMMQFTDSAAGDRGAAQWYSVCRDANCSVVLV